MASLKSAFTSCWRRRTLLHRVLPAFLQAVIVLAVWEVIKSQLQPTDDGVDSSGLKSARSLTSSSCPPSELSRATTLGLLDLSSLVSVSTHNQPDTYRLKVDVYVRDAKFGYLILYPQGSQATAGDLKSKLLGGSDDDKVGAPRNSGPVPVDVETGPSALFKDTDKSSRFGESYSKLSTGKKEAGQDEDEEETGNVDSGVENRGVKFGSEKELGLARRQTNTRTDGGVHVMSYPSKETSAKPPNYYLAWPGDKSNSPTQSSSKGKQPSHPMVYLNMLHQNLAKSLESSNSEAGGQQTGLDSGSSVITRGVLIDENGERVYSEGFLERISKLKSEIFGKAANNRTVNDVPSNFLINNPEACQSLKDIEVLFLITSQPQNVDIRQQIRDTFVNPSSYPDVRIVHQFILGTSPTYGVQQEVQEEQVVYQDIVQGDFLDSPGNASLKGLLGMRWVTQYCFLAKYIFIINDDVFVDTDKLVYGLLPTIKRLPGKRLMLCSFNPESDIVRTGPGAVSQDLFPGRTRMRPYCKGFAVLLTRGAVSSLLAASEYIPPIELPELYLFGILPFVAGSVDVYDLGFKRAFHNVGIETVNCYKSLQEQCPLVASVAYNQRFATLWAFVQARTSRDPKTWESLNRIWEIESRKRKF